MTIRSVLLGGIPAALVIAGMTPALGFGADWSSTSEPTGGPLTVAQATTPTTPTTPTGQTPAAKPQGDEKPGPGWAVNCKSGAKEKALDCRLSQTVVTKNRQVLTEVTFHFPPAGEESETIIQVPLGVLLSGGGTVQVDQNPPQSVTFRACNRNGCYGRAVLSSEFLSQLRKGKQVTVVFKNLSEKEVKVPLSLDGFSDAYGKVPSS